MNKINVFIADDHPVVRKGMVRLLKTFERVGEVKEAADGKELITLLNTTMADAVIIDIEMPVIGGVDTVRVISQRFPEVKILMLTMHSEDVFVNRLVDLGVNGFLTKSSEPEELERALYAIVDKEFYKNALIDNALRNGHHHEEYEGGKKLTLREVEILLLICQELSPGEIAQRLQISEKTFFNHRTNILEKTGSKTNVGLLRYAIKKGITSA